MRTTDVHAIPPKDAPGEGYVLLSEGDVLKDGDEYWSFGQWQQTCATSKIIGTPGTLDTHGFPLTYRRKTNGGHHA